jgi:hypothetical protein
MNCSSRNCNKHGDWKLEPVTTHPALYACDTHLGPLAAELHKNQNTKTEHHRVTCLLLPSID